MIEIIYKEEKTTGTGNEEIFHLPKNIRQIGLPGENCKIYMEDYVCTFLKKMSEETLGGAAAAILLGQTKFREGTTYIFIRCALKLEEKMSLEHIPFTENMWEKINEDMKKYFPGQDVVGWFFTAFGLPMRVENVLYRMHLTYFGGRDKVLYLIDVQEREEAFFRYDSGQMYRQTGYYIYYEKNPMMQAYMIEKNQNLSIEDKEKVSDTAVKNFRKIIQGKTEEEDEDENTGVHWFSYVVTAALAIAVLAAGTNFLGSYQKMRAAQEQIEAVSAQLTEGKNLLQTTPTIFPQKTESKGLEVTTTVAPTKEPVLSMEAKKEETPRFYRIQEGDTLNSIVMDAYGNTDKIEEIREKNDIDEAGTIYAGQIIILP